MALAVTLAAIAVIALARDGWRGGSGLNLADLLPSGLYAAEAAACGRGALTGEVTRVRDGDTIEVRGVAIRLSGLAAPERGERGGPEATAAMRELVAGRSLRCRLDGSRTHDRCAGVCYRDGADIAAELVRRGLARDCPRYSGGRYAAAEREAARAGATIGATYRLPGYCRSR
ncbi:MAG TPA: thermonuclease family protein [Geminicoccaceae bacterium]|nr:thermonuclease family protein [Geminicoccaceae bacterium]